LNSLAEVWTNGGDKNNRWAEHTAQQYDCDQTGVFGLQTHVWTKAHGMKTATCISD
jgi:hypothetical protein